jgi:putative nucleotidyltransferase with HDIG domain
LRVINQITARGEEAREAGFKRCKDVVDKVLEVAAQESDVYTEILKIWSSQESIMHSAGVGTLAVMFAMCLGYQDEQILADIVVAAVFHDVGKVQMADVASKPNTQRTSAENSVFESHVAKSFTMVKECGLEFHPRIYRMISEHHENYDGSGFPKGLQGNEISESSQLLRLANFFDELISGADNGKPMSPSEAFDFIYTSESEATHGLRISPELMHRLFQFMERERVASEVSLEASAQQVAKTTNKLRV